jgi:hypothetical protein
MPYTSSSIDQTVVYDPARVSLFSFFPSDHDVHVPARLAPTNGTAAPSK